MTRDQKKAEARALGAKAYREGRSIMDYPINYGAFAIQYYEFGWKDAKAAKKKADAKRTAPLAR